MENTFELDQKQKEIKSLIFPYIKAMSYELLQKKPDNIIQFMIKFLNKYGNYTTSGLTKKEKKELEELRKLVKHYRELEMHNSFEAIDEEKSENNEKQNDDNQTNSDEENRSEEEKDVMDEEEEKKFASKLKGIKATQDQQSSIKNRTSVSAEVYGFYNKKGDYKPRVIPKNESQMNRIKSKIISSFIFSSLDKGDLDVVIKAMEEKRFNQNEKVITQGENGDCLYIVETGTLQCFKTFESQETKLVHSYEPGESFGELALLYNCPRAATVICSSPDCILWALDRETFNHIVKEAAQKKREKYENFLKNVDILSTIDPYELQQICDSIKTGVFKKDDFIIKEGELGDVFYIIEEGKCNATKTVEPGKMPTLLRELSEGHYFGERALLSGEPRYANIVVTSSIAKVLSLDRQSFNRLLGPIIDILKRNMDKYQIYCSKEANKELNFNDSINSLKNSNSENTLSNKGSNNNLNSVKDNSQNNKVSSKGSKSNLKDNSDSNKISNKGSKSNLDSVKDNSFNDISANSVNNQKNEENSKNNNDSNNIENNNDADNQNVNENEKEANKLISLNDVLIPNQNNDYSLPAAGSSVYNSENQPTYKVYNDTTEIMKNSSGNFNKTSEEINVQQNENNENAQVNPSGDASGNNNDNTTNANYNNYTDYNNYYYNNNNANYNNNYYYGNNTNYYNYTDNNYNNYYYNNNNNNAVYENASQNNNENITSNNNLESIITNNTNNNVEPYTNNENPNENYYPETNKNNDANEETTN